MHRVLVPYDFSSNARRALALAMQGFPFGRGTEVELLHVVDSDLYDNVLASKYVPSDDAIRSYLKDEVTQIQTELEVANSATSALELLAPKTTVVRGRAHACIDEAMRGEGVAGVLIGGQGHGGVRERLLGRTAQRVIRHAEVPVLIVKRGRDLGLPTRIMSGVDWSLHSNHALALAARLSTGRGGKLEVVHVIDSPYVPYMKAFAHERDASGALDEIRGQQLMRLETFIDRALAKLEPAPTITKQILFGDPAETLAAHARTSLTELLVVGSHGHSDSPRYLLGSTAEKLVTSTAADILVVT